MRKIFKLLITLAIIAGVAFGAYKLFVKKDNSKEVFNTIYEYNYNLKDGKTNITEELDTEIAKMVTILNEETTMANVKTDLQNYLYMKNLYKDLNTEILNYGALTSHNKEVQKYVNIVNNSFKHIKEIYNEAYLHLVKNYKTIDQSTEYNKQTMYSYIENFDNILKKSTEHIHKMYFNAGIVYAHTLDNSLTKTNAYKLNVEYTCHLINLYYANGEYNNTFKSEAETKAKSIISSSQSYVDKYFLEVLTYNKLIEKSYTFNIEEIIKCEKENKLDNYLSTLEKEEDKAMIGLYVEKVVRG